MLPSSRTPLPPNPHPTTRNNTTTHANASGDAHVLGLDVAVDQVHGVQVLHRLGYLDEHLHDGDEVDGNGARRHALVEDAALERLLVVGFWGVLGGFGGLGVWRFWGVWGGVRVCGEGEGTQRRRGASRVASRAWRSEPWSQHSMITRLQEATALSSSACSLRKRTASFWTSAPAEFCTTPPPSSTMSVRQA